jgi:hypothetical protein
MDVWHARAESSALQFEEQFLLFLVVTYILSLGSWAHMHVTIVTFRMRFIAMVTVKYI